MQVVILAGGRGTRLAEITEITPKPMVEIGGRPILWHIMKHFSHYGLREFLVAVGYKSDVIKRYFLEYSALTGNLSVGLASGEVTLAGTQPEDWTVHLVDTGIDTSTGGRIKRLQPWLAEDTFMMTYGDGVCSVPLDELVAFHRRNGALVTLTAVRPPARFGSLEIDGAKVTRFAEKSQTAEGWINGGFMVLEPGVLEHIEGDTTSFELDVLSSLARQGELAAYLHDGFWQCMDTLRDLQLLENLWAGGHPPWRVWVQRG